jgi:hypothetical protein
MPTCVCVCVQRYSVAGSWDVNSRTGGGAEHTGPDTPLMRRVYSPTKLGACGWLNITPVLQYLRQFVPSLPHRFSSETKKTAGDSLHRASVLAWADRPWLQHHDVSTQEQLPTRYRFSRKRLSSALHGPWFLSLHLICSKLVYKCKH